MATLRLLTFMVVSVALVSSNAALPVASPDGETKAEPPSDGGEGVVGGGAEVMNAGVDVGQVIADTTINMAVVFLSGAMSIMDKIQG